LHQEFKKKNSRKFRQRGNTEILEPIGTEKDGSRILRVFGYSCRGKVRSSVNFVWVSVWLRDPFRDPGAPLQIHRFSTKTDKKDPLKNSGNDGRKILEPNGGQEGLAPGSFGSLIDLDLGSLIVRRLCLGFRLARGSSCSYAYQKKVFDKFSFFMLPERCFLLTFGPTLRSKFPSTDFDVFLPEMIPCFGY
jgi:hypothetical protein